MSNRSIIENLRRRVENAENEVANFSNKFTREMQAIRLMLSEVEKMLVEPAVAEELPGFAEPVTPDKTPEKPTAEPVKQSALNDLSELLLFALSPDVIPAGTGIIASTDRLHLVNAVTMFRYVDDASVLCVDDLTEWPSGFYINQETKARQLFIKFADVYLICNIQENSWTTNGAPMFVVLEPETGWIKKSANEMTETELVSAVNLVRRGFVELLENYFRPYSEQS